MSLEDVLCGDPVKMRGTVVTFNIKGIPVSAQIYS